MNKSKLIEFVRFGRIIDIKYDELVNLIRIFKVDYNKIDDIFIVILEFVSFPSQPYAELWQDSDTLIEIEGEYKDYNNFIMAIEDYFGKSIDNIIADTTSCTNRSITEQDKKRLKEFNMNRLKEVRVPKYSSYVVKKYSFMGEPKFVINQES